MVLEKWPAIRLAIYSSIGVLCAVAMFFGWIDQDQATSISDQAGWLLGLVASIVAGANVTRAPIAARPSADGVAQVITSAAPAVEHAAATGAAAVDQARRELERQLTR
ncbi:hypothetical protein DEU38_103204 [Rhodococcus sp. AG1013]|uniref:hypothetical protein n=1 Tax=Rhodococcus sp. AG1013 TaxID=2183996 RepID=UPI000E0CADE5|nr:hypothetical protein [Rhodococcus sp. AG1013]RDI32471.1 hypothetical protein DEU38_103204 [Rhodococcus sp. AG1013]